MILVEQRSWKPGNDLKVRLKDYPFPFPDIYGSYLESSGLGRHLLCISDDGQILMPVRKYKSGFLTIIQILHPPLKNGQRLEGEEELVFLEKFLSRAGKDKWADRISQPPTHVVFKSAPLKTVSAGFGTWYLSLAEKDEAELWNGLHGKHRNVIRNAENKGVVIKEGVDQLRTFYSLYTPTMNRAGMSPEPFSEFQALSDALNPGHLICAVAYFNEKPLGALLMPYSAYGAYYVYGASAEDMEINGAMNYLHWHMILKMKALGVQRYDFVGARLSNVAGTRLGGIQQFKLRFGCTLESGLIWKADLNMFKCRAYDLLVKMYWKLKGVRLRGDIIDQELAKPAE
ncbi:MAG: lipid II:glycine glycyltransferase FemX [Bacteroidia bacterium]